MSIIECPVCQHEHDDADYPDTLSGMGGNNRVWFECAECEAEFEMAVDFEAIFYPIKETATLKRWGDPVA